MKIHGLHCKDILEIQLHINVFVLYLVFSKFISNSTKCFQFNLLETFSFANIYLPSLLRDSSSYKKVCEGVTILIGSKNKSIPFLEDFSRIKMGLKLFFQKKLDEIVYMQSGKERTLGQILKRRQNSNWGGH